MANFAMLVVCLLAGLLLPLPFPPVLDQMLARIGDTLAPLALVSVGLQLRLEALRENLRPLCLGLGYKLLLCPATPAPAWSTAARSSKPPCRR